MSSSSRVITSSFLMLAIAGLAAGCTSSKAPSAAPQNQPGQNVQPQSGPAWALTLKSTCTAGQAGVANDQCLAKYGYKVTADGEYQVGPGPQGQVRKGTLSQEQLNALKAKVEAAVALMTAPGAAATESHEADVENTSDDIVALERPGAAESVLARNASGDFYFSFVTAEDAKALHAAIRDLANEHYRLPFGDACGDAAEKINVAAAAVTECQVDADCVYIDAWQGFAVIPPASEQWVRTEDCSAVKPPVVANKLAILGAVQGLGDLYTEAQTACGDEFWQTYFGQLDYWGRSCSVEYKVTSTLPVCVQNRCVSKL